MVDLRGALEEHAAVEKEPNPASRDHHLFLVLDRSVQCFPWESIPILRGQSVSRIPSLSFLLDRVQLARHQRGLPLSLNSSEPKGPELDCVVVNPRKAYYVLNPSGDLKRTEGQFIDWLKGMGDAGWNGVVGRAPSEVELSQALNKSDLVL